MSRQKKDPLRDLTVPERQELEQLSRSQVAHAVGVTRAKLLLAIPRGDDHQDAAPTPFVWGGKRAARRQRERRHRLGGSGPAPASRSRGVPTYGHRQAK